MCLDFLIVAFWVVFPDATFSSTMVSSLKIASFFSSLDLIPSLDRVLAQSSSPRCPRQLGISLLAMDIDMVFVSEVLVAIYTNEPISFRCVLPLPTPTSLLNKFLALMCVLVDYGYMFFRWCGLSTRPPWTSALCDMALTSNDTLVAMWFRRT